LIKQTDICPFCQASFHNSSQK